MALKFTHATGVFSADVFNETENVSAIKTSSQSLSAAGEFTELNTWPSNKSLLVLRKSGSVETAGIFEGVGVLNAGTLIGGHEALTTSNFVPTDPIYSSLKGARGTQGVQGTVGNQGTKGPQGFLGLKGLKGTQGDIGFTGPIGLIGTTGPIGVQGTQGDQGILGPRCSRFYRISRN